MDAFISLRVAYRSRFAASAGLVAVVLIGGTFLLRVWLATFQPTALIPAAQPSAAPQIDLSHPAQKKAAEDYGKLPLAFEANRGQTNPQVQFLSRGPGYTLFLTADEAVLKLQNLEADTASARSTPIRDADPQSPAILRMKLVGANPAPRVSALDELPGKSNYFIGNDAKKWHTQVPNYARVEYHETYPGVNLVYYGDPRQLEYDFVVAPGADPHAITLDVSGDDVSSSRDVVRHATPIQIAKNGDLLVVAQGREIRFKQPVVYQEEAQRDNFQLILGVSSAAKTRHFISGRWVVKHGNQVGFELGPYDRSKALVIDPALVYATYLGGSLDNTAYNVSADAAGNAYVTGTTTSTDFPTKNPFQAVEAGSSDVFVAKLNATGTALVYSTYVGGSGQDYAFWITVDASNRAHVTGSTSSANFPVTAGVVQSTCGGGCQSGTRNAFVTVLNATGSALVYSTYLGGTGKDQANVIQVDSSANTYISGWTTSSDFPTTTGAYQTTFGGTSDAFVAKLNPKGTLLLYSTLLGVSNDTRAFGVGLDKTGDAYITGYTSSAGYPTTSGAFQSALKGSSNAFVTELNPTATGLVYSTYLGGSGADIAWAIAMDSSNNAYVAGQTTSADFPTTPGALRTTCSTTCANNDAFVTKFNPTGTGLVYSTYLGGSNGEQEAYALSVDTSGDAFVTGRTKSTNFPITRGAFFPANKGSFDGFVAELRPAGAGFVYSTYLGGSSTDTGLGIAVDATGNVYVVGRTYSTDLPITPNAIEPLFVGTTQGFVAKFVPGDQVWPLALSFGTQTLGSTSAPLTAALTNSGTSVLTISSVAIAGTAAADYAISTNKCGATLAVGVSCSISVTFTPTTTGVLAAALTIADSAPNSPQMVALTGTGTGGVLNLTPSTLTFSTQLIGTSSPSQPATLTNVSAAAVSITNIATSSHYSQTNNCPASLASAASCIINVVFQPTAQGTQKGTLTVSNSATSPVTVALTGVGTVMSLSPSSVSFGNQAVGTSSPAQGVTIKNVGTAAVTITKISITGARVSSFSQTNNCPISPSTLAAGATCTANVVFTPQLKGALGANLSVFDSGGGSPQTAQLTGNGT